MIPGASKAMKDVEIEDDAFKHIEAIIHSGTKYDRCEKKAQCERIWDKK
jgi:signal recognition particle subunit SRP54